MLSGARIGKELNIEHIERRYLQLARCSALPSSMTVCCVVDCRRCRTNLHLRFPFAHEQREVSHSELEYIMPIKSTSLSMRVHFVSPKPTLILRSAFVVVTALAAACGLQCQEQTTASGVSLIEAVRYTLEHHPTLLRQMAQVQIIRGVQAIASSNFDGIVQAGVLQSKTVVPENTQLNSSGGIGIVSDKFTQTTLSTGYSQLLRNGISISPTYTVTREISSFLGPGGINTATSGLTVVFPLLRGRGHGAVAAQEDSAKEEVDATSLDLDQQVSLLILNTASSYWRLLAAQQFLQVAVDVERRGQTYVDNTQALVDADRVPRNDLHEVTANFAQLSSQRISAESALIGAKLQLASDLGLPPEKILASTAAPSDDFPNSAIQVLPADNSSSLNSYYSLAIKSRADYLAAVKRTREQSLLLTGARNRLLPQLDLAVSGGYSQAQEGTRVGRLYSAPLSPGLGPNVSAGITLSLPIHNSAAIGSVMESSGAVKQAQLDAENIARNIGQSVAAAIEQLRTAARRVQQSSNAVHEFETALAGARQKYGLGVGSIVEILTIEDKLTTALNSQIQAKLDYAESLAQLRFATGTFLAVGQPVQKISGDIFFSLPIPQPGPALN